MIGTVLFCFSSAGDERKEGQNDTVLLLEACNRASRPDTGLLPLHTVSLLSLEWIRCRAGTLTFSLCGHVWLSCFWCCYSNSTDSTGNHLTVGKISKTSLAEKRLGYKFCCHQLYDKIYFCEDVLLLNICLYWSDLILLLSRRRLCFVDVRRHLTTYPGSVCSGLSWAFVYANWTIVSVLMAPSAERQRKLCNIPPKNPLLSLKQCGDVPGFITLLFVTPTVLFNLLSASSEQKWDCKCV